MSEFKGTKGEWHVERHDQVMCNGKTVADCENNRKMNWECEANAKLISCAPEMLEMLDKLCEELEFHQVSISMAKEARELITKATTV